MTKKTIPAPDGAANAGAENAAVAPESAPAAPDEFAGQGGSYLKDPVTGARVLVNRTEQRCC
jgi:hypothetical protein